MALPFAVPRSLAPGFTMARCTPRDIPQMVSVYIAAFTATRYTYWWSSVETMRRWNEARFRLRFRDPTDHQFKVVDNSNGRIVGFARWRVPEGMKGLAQGFQTYNEVAEDEYDGLESQWMHDPPKGSNEAQYHEFFTAIRGAGQRWDAKNKLDLSLICAHPEYHRRGIAAALLQSVLAVADAEGFTTYLEAVGNAVPVYQRYGFKAVDRLEFDLARAGGEENVDIEIMLREPQPAKVSEH